MLLIANERGLQEFTEQGLEGIREATAEIGARLEWLEEPGVRCAKEQSVDTPYVPFTRPIRGFSACPPDDRAWDPHPSGGPDAHMWPDWTPELQAPQDAIYTDGSKTGKGLGAGVYDAGTGESHPVAVVGGGEVLHAELSAILYALRHVTPREEFTLFTDSLISLFLIRKCLDRPDALAGHVAESLVRAVCRAMKDRTEPVALLKVAAHVGIVGNEEADRIAKSVAEGEAEGDLPGPLGARTGDRRAIPVHQVPEEDGTMFWTPVRDVAQLAKAEGLRAFRRRTDFGTQIMDLWSFGDTVRYLDKVRSNIHWTLKGVSDAGLRCVARAPPYYFRTLHMRGAQTTEGTNTGICHGSYASCNQ